MSELSPWVKLWYKGVDIAAGVITSLIASAVVAFIVTVTWRWNKSRDLKHEEAKERQKHRIAREQAETDRIEAEGYKIQRLQRERNALVNAAYAAPDVSQTKTYPQKL